MYTYLYIILFRNLFVCLFSYLFVSLFIFYFFKFIYFLLVDLFQYLFSYLVIDLFVYHLTWQRDSNTISRVTMFDFLSLMSLQSLTESSSSSSSLPCNPYSILSPIYCACQEMAKHDVNAGITNPYLSVKIFWRVPSHLQITGRTKTVYFLIRYLSSALRAISSQPLVDKIVREMSGTAWKRHLVQKGMTGV